MTFVSAEVPVTLTARRPFSLMASPLFEMFIELRLSLVDEVTLTPVVLLFVMVPPVQVGVAVVQVPLFPVTVSPPLLPVVVRMMPEFALALVELMLRKVTPLAPMVVLEMFNAVPVVVVKVLTIVLLSWVALTVPPPVAANAGLTVVLRLRPPLKLIIEPVLVSRLMPLTPAAVAVIGPDRFTVPPVLFLITTGPFPEVAWVMEPA